MIVVVSDFQVSSVIPSNRSWKLAHFEYVSPREIMKIISTTSNSTCHLDPLPVSILKKCLYPLLLPLSLIINKSLSTGVFPSIWKKSLVFPTLKKASLDPENLFNYRPTSNLSFRSKVIERVIVTQLESYLHQNNLFPTRQSAYRRYHSAETMMLKITNDLALSLDRNMDVAFVLLDLSSAFDTVDHNILLQILEEKFGFTGIVQKWVKSYLAERIQTVAISKVEFLASPMSCGVPQGSVLGPLLFLLYISPIQEFAQYYNMEIMNYADDTQLYTSLTDTSSTTQLENFERCLNDIIHWCQFNMMKCNPEKTKLIHFSLKFKNVFSSFKYSRMDTRLSW